MAAGADYIAPEKRGQVIESLEIITAVMGRVRGCDVAWPPNAGKGEHADG